MHTVFIARVPLFLHHSIKGTGTDFSGELLWDDCTDAGDTQIIVSFLQIRSCLSAQVSELRHL